MIFIYFRIYNNDFFFLFTDIKALVGDTATLICPIVASCGALHSIKWYRENERIAVMAESSNFIKIEGNMKDR